MTTLDTARGYFSGVAVSFALGTLVALGARPPATGPTLEPPIATVPPTIVEPEPDPSTLAATGIVDWLNTGDPIAYLAVVALPVALIGIGVALVGLTLERRDRRRARKEVAR